MSTVSIIVTPPRVYSGTPRRAGSRQPAPERRAPHQPHRPPQPARLAGVVGEPDRLGLRAEAIDHDRLHGAVALEPLLAVDAADPALPHAAEGRLGDAIRDH